MAKKSVQSSIEPSQQKGHSAVTDVKVPMLMVLMVVVGVFAGPGEEGTVLMAGSLALAAVPCVLLYMTLTLHR